MTCLVRQLSPTGEGIPLEIYAFTTVTAWSDYERIQADVFDHLLSVVSTFGLRIFQQPTEFDVGTNLERGCPVIGEEVMRVPHRVTDAQWDALNDYAMELNGELAASPRKSVDAAERKLRDRVDDFGLDDVLRVESSDRTLRLRWRRG